MALCRRQCPDCPVLTTVLVEGSDRTKARAGLDTSAANLTACFTNIVSETRENDPDIALILRIDGLDINVKCSHYTADISLF